jgi:hypothetical protein
MIATWQALTELHDSDASDLWQLTSVDSPSSVGFAVDLKNDAIRSYDGRTCGCYGGLLCKPRFIVGQGGLLTPRRAG